MQGLFASVGTNVVLIIIIVLQYSIFGSVIWPCVPVVVPPQQQGTAYGIMTSFQNAGQFVMPLILQQIFRQSKNFGPCEGFFIVSSALGVTVAAMIWFADERMNHAVLRLPDTTVVPPPPRHDDHGVHGHLHFADLPMEIYRDRHGKHLYQYGSIDKVHPSHSSDRIQIPVPQLPITSSAISNTSSLSSTSQNIPSGSPSSTHGMLSARSFEGQAGADQHPPVAKSEVPLLGVSKFALLRSFSMPASRGSVSKDLCALAEQSSHDAPTSKDNGSQRSQPSSMANSYTNSFIPQGQQGSGNSQSSSPSDIRPMVIVPIPSVVHHSQEYYDRANAFQFPREDPLALRRQISENNRTQAQPYWLGIAQSAPAYPGQATSSQMEEYQKYRQEQVQMHNQLPQTLQQQQLVLAPPRRSVRSIF